MFKQENGFNRLFSSFYERYRSYGRLEKGITVIIEKPTELERDAIGGLMGHDYSKKKKITITASQFERGLQKTKYGKWIPDISLTEIVELYVGEKLLTKKEAASTYLEDRSSFFLSFKTPEHPDELHQIVDWILSVENKNNRYYAQFKQNKAGIEKNLKTLSLLFQSFPLKEPVYLPIFASKVTRNPHAFDGGTERGEILIHALQVLQEIMTGAKIKPSLNAEEINELLFKFNLLRDDLTNYVTIFNIEGTNHSGEPNELLRGLVTEKSAVNLPLKEVMKLSMVSAKNNTVFMIENSSVSSYIIDELIRLNKDVSIICGNGFLKLATLKFLDIFIRNGGTIYYSGDCDPEGVGIAQRLISRYGESVRLFLCDRASYLKSLSDESIEPSRLAQLGNNIEDKELQEVKDEMLAHKKAGYQENILDEILTYVMNDLYI
ncbi:TIGR02679 domain-containing protein [Bacillus sp. B-jedd]|uniref:TIGR02679 domain-containing protein n=1 Tax=Bacillus sp. B-jedd TaxID=1476857 RepID=UPI0022B0E2D2|nr:TIGR02679 domain-containing protein [Bacillus sp. B-jedd]